MTIRIASFNLENLFTRPTAMQVGGAQGQEAIDSHALLNAIICKDSYSEADKDELIRLDKKYHFSALNPPAKALVYLVKVRGHLFHRDTATGTVTVVANGAGDWTGWFELRREDVNWPAIYNTGRVIDEVKPDILVCIEVENRPTLQRFNDQVLGAKFNRRFEHVMVIDGNDSRGIDVGILSRYPITRIQSHVDDRANGKLIFSRDCPEYVFALPNGDSLVICPNHFKSKRGGNNAETQARRTAQGARAAAILRMAEQQISQYVLLAGDLNDTPDSDTLAALFKDGWEDIKEHESYPKDRPGTFGTGTASNKLDYLIMSPRLRSKSQHTGIERGGSYHPRLWKPFDTVTGAADEASDHHCVYADFAIGT